MLAIVGGAKVSSKLEVLKSLATKVDHLIVGGGIANTFLAASGINVGKSLCETDLIPLAKELMAQTSIPLPIDVVVAKEFSAEAVATTKLVAEISDDDMILDIGPQTAAMFADTIAAMKTIIWNGPVGVFEIPQLAHGTEAIAKSGRSERGLLDRRRRRNHCRDRHLRCDRIDLVYFDRRRRLFRIRAGRSIARGRHFAATCG